MAIAFQLRVRNGCQEVPRKSGRTEVEWNISASGLFWRT